MCDEIDIIFAYFSFYFYDFNFIEISFAILKKWMKKYKHFIDEYNYFEKFLKKTML